MSGLEVARALFAAALETQRRDNPKFPLLNLACEIAELGELTLPLDVAHELDRQPPDGLPEVWYAHLAGLYARLGCGEDVDRLIARSIEAEAESPHTQGTFAIAYERLARTELADAALARKPRGKRADAAAKMAEIAAAGGRLARAEKLAKQVGVSARADAVDVRLAIARAHAAAGDRTAALAWLDRAASLAAEPKHMQPNLDIALVAAEVGATTLALELARAVDRATASKVDPYGSHMHLVLARVYERAGEPAKVDKILAGHAAVHRGTSFGSAWCARDHAELGRMAPVPGLIAEAERALRTPDDEGNGALATAYAAIRDFAKAIAHASLVRGTRMRVAALFKVARVALTHPPEVTPDLLAAIAQVE